MKTSVQTIPSVWPAATSEPGPGALLMIFWAAFASAVVAMQVIDPDIFVRQDPDSLMRLVEARDLLGGQPWFDLVQHRLDPPNGVLMHWSRLIDAPLAGLLFLGKLTGIGERLALTAWPLLLLLAYMVSSLGAATALAGRRAVVPSLVLCLLFFDPLLSFLPNSLDHHNAQVMLMTAVFALSLRLKQHPLYGLAAGFLCAVSLAVGLEMLPCIAVFGTIIALWWAFGAEAGRGTACFGLAFAAGPAALFLLTGSPAAPMTCDALSWSYALPAAVAGLGLAALAYFVGPATGTTWRLVSLGVLAALCGALFLLVSPQCLDGPYGALAPELKALWLSTITEAQPVLTFAIREPVGIIATLGPPAVAFAVALYRARLGTGTRGAGWALAAALVGVPLLLSLYEVRTLQLANALAIPVLAAWLAEEASRLPAAGASPLRRALPLVVPFLLTMPLAHLGIGWAAARGLSLATDGRMAPVERPDAPADRVAALTRAEKDCVDPGSAALLAAVPKGLVMSPVFYGPSVLAISDHLVVAGPYHRAGAAILDAIHAMDLPPEGAQSYFRKRGADYLAICSTSTETALIKSEAPTSLASRLLAGEQIPWLEPVRSPGATELRLWRVRI